MIFQVTQRHIILSKSFEFWAFIVKHFHDILSTLHVQIYVQQISDIPIWFREAHGCYVILPQNILYGSVQRIAKTAFDPTFMAGSNRSQAVRNYSQMSGSLGFFLFLHLVKV